MHHFHPLKLNIISGGSFVGTRTVLTAAHCVDGGTSGTAIFGAHFFRNDEPNQRRIDFLAPHIFMHPSWNPLLIQNDVAVVQLPILVPIVPGAIRQAILPTPADVNYDFANEDAGKNEIFCTFGQLFILVFLVSCIWLGSLYTS